MYSKWTSHLKDDKKKEAFKQSVLGSRQVLDRAVEILREEQDSISKEELDPKNYTSGYSHYQAFLNGQRSGLNKAQSLLNLDQQGSK